MRHPYRNFAGLAIFTAAAVGVCPEKLNAATLNTSNPANVKLTIEPYASASFTAGSKSGKTNDPGGLNLSIVATINTNHVANLSAAVTAGNTTTGVHMNTPLGLSSNSVPKGSTQVTITANISGGNSSNRTYTWGTGVETSRYAGPYPTPSGSSLVKESLQVSGDGGPWTIVLTVSLP